MTGVILQISVSNGGVPKRAIERGIVWEEGLEGDRQADLRAHGGPSRAVCLYSFEVIERLRAEGHPIGPGATGENVTVGALDWSLVVPGVEMRLGDEVRLEVTGVRDAVLEERPVVPRRRRRPDEPVPAPGRKPRLRARAARRGDPRGRPGGAEPLDARHAQRAAHNRARTAGRATSSRTLGGAPRAGRRYLQSSASVVFFSR